MFIKYLKLNLKNNCLEYALIMICEVIMLCFILTANGIISNSVAEENNSKYEASRFFLGFKEPVKTADIAGKVDEFVERIPYEFKDINLLFPNKQSDAEFYGSSGLFLFKDYDTLKEFMKEQFDLSPDQIPTKQEFDNKEKVVMVGTSLNMFHGNSTAYESVVDGYIDIMGEKYKVSGYYNGVGVYLFWGTQPVETQSSCFLIDMKDVMTEKQTNEIISLYKEIFGEIPLASEQLPETYALLDQRANEANIGLSIIMMLISVFNILLIFKYMMSLRKRSFAIFRFCGFKKITCILYSAAEFLLLSAASSILSCVIFDVLLKPILAGYYSIFEIIFTLDYYAVIIAAYFVISLIMFIIYIAPSLNKTISDELRGI